MSGSPSNKDSHKPSALLYAAGLSAGAVGLAILIYLAGTAGDYHAAMGYAFVLVFSIPFIAMAGLLGIFTHEWYLPLRGTWGGRGFCVLQMLIAIALGVVAVFALGWLVH